MRINKYGTKKVMIDNHDGTYTFLNVTLWEVFKYYMSAKLTKNMIQENSHAKEKSNKSIYMDR